MSKSNPLKPVHLALGTAFALSLGSGVASADQNPFAMTELSSGYMVADQHEGKCGGEKTKEKVKEKAMEGKCGEGKCGGDMAKEKAQEKTQEKEKAMEGKCGGNR